MGWPCRGVGSVVKGEGQKLNELAKGHYVDKYTRYCNLLRFICSAGTSRDEVPPIYRRLAPAA